MRASHLLRLLLSLVVLAACDDTPMPADGGTDAGEVVIPDGYPKASCDALDPSLCALPWPSGLYLEPADTESGVRLTFGDDSLPANAARRALEPALFDGLDGYGLGTPILASLGALDYSTLPDEWDGIDASVEADSRSLLFRVLDGGALERVPHFVEPDRYGDANDPLTALRPAVILAPATRYLVAFRNLTLADGTSVEPSPGFLALRDGTPSNDPGIEARRAEFDDLFEALAGEGVAREELTLAWGFTTGSEAALHRRLDQSIAAGLAAAPNGGTITVDTVERFAATDDGSGDEVNEFLRYRLIGRMTRPMVVERPDGGQGWRMSLDAAGDVTTAGEGETPVLIHVPHRALEGDPAGVIVYGHGLFGSEDEIRAGHLQQLAEEQGFIMVGVPLVGMASTDLEAVVAALTDLNNFGVIGDGLHQGVLDHHFAIRAARETLATVLTDVDASISIDPTDVHFFGASQGGIFGQTILATSPDISNAVVAVPGNNYVTLLQRSTNFSDFDALLSAVYSSPDERAVILASIQLLWDRTDPVSYIGRMLEPARFGDPARRAMLLVSKGDYQVPVLTNEIAARTWPSLLPSVGPYDATRSPSGIQTVTYPHEGTGMILFDFGNPWPDDRGNLPPEDGLTDPHPRLAEIDEAGGQLATFLREGRIEDICGGDGCTPQ